MNNLTPNQSQNQFTPDKTQASLGFGTKILEHLLPEAPPDASQNAPDASMVTPGQAITPESDKTPPPEDMGAKIADLETKFGELEKSIKKTIEDEIGKIKDLINPA